MEKHFLRKLSMAWIAFWLIILAWSIDARSQCTTVCGTVHLSAGTITVSNVTIGTVTVSAKGNYSVATTYSYVTVTGLNTINAGALSVSVSNVGNESALFNGTGLPSGATLNIEIPNATLPAYTYNCLSSSLLVLVNR